ncbi:MAG TPA: hypothetical protein VLP43_02990, partial [Solirubrobacteraceae bacterium]|nr:hypothetical protein [Solirubrobacteraceae bacterium]
MVAMIDVGEERRDGAVRREAVVAPVGEQLGLRADESGAADDQPPGTEHGLGDLSLAGVGVVLDGDPVGVGNQGDQSPDRLALLDPDRELDALPGECAHQLVVLKSRVGADHDLSGMTGAADAGEELVNEPGGAALRVRLALAVADV